ncbi:MAG: M23 family metallopeptidase [Spirochaetota bacterium]
MKGVAGVQGRVISAYSACRRVLRRRFTVMVVPHTARRPVTFHIGFTGLVFSAVLLSAIAVGSIWMIQDGMQRLDQLADREQEVHQVQASVDSIRDDIQGLLSSAREFDSVLARVLSQIPGNATGSVETEYAGLSGLQPDGRVGSDVEIVDRLAALLSSSGRPIAEAVEAIENKDDFLADIPTQWPVSGGRGVVTHEWGPNIHPFYGRWYMHTGIDIAWGHGSLPLVATANGTVVDTGNQDYGYGLYVDIEHRFGIRTKYAHMSRIDVSVGDEVKQGDRIGMLGSTGLSTGRHIHYEIIVGGQNVDPSGYLTITNEFNRRTTRRSLR